MGGAAEELKQKLSQQIDVVSRKLELLKKDVSDLNEGDMAAVSERRDRRCSLRQSAALRSKGSAVR